MDVHFNYAYDDLGKYSKGSFIYEGEIYMKVNATDNEVTRGLQKLFENHPDLDIKFKAMQACIIHLSRIILHKHC